MADKKISALTASSTPLAGTEVLPIVQSGATVKVAVSNLTAGRDVGTKNILSTDGGNVGGAGGFVGVAANAGNSAMGGIKGGLANSAGSEDQGDLYLQTRPTGGAGQALRTVFIAGVDGNVAVPIGNLIMQTAAKGINFTANTPQAGMTSQLLNWYEQGTWTPTRNNFTEVLGGGAITSTGTYTRVGNTVLVQVVLTCTGGATIASTNGAVSFFSGLPFAPATWTPGSWVESTLTSSGAMIAHPNTNFYVSTAWIAASKTWYFSSTYAV